MAADQNKQLKADPNEYLIPEEFLKLSIPHLVKPEDLNHHGTLFAGQMARWLIEAGLILSSRLTGKPEDIVCVQLNGMTFKKPVNNGDLIEIQSMVSYLGSTSIMVYSQVLRKQETIPLITNSATFVTVGKDGRPYKHGLKLPDEYIAENSDMCEEALKIRGQK